MVIKKISLSLPVPCRVRVKDLKFVEAFADALKKIGLNPNYRQDRHGYWHLQAQSKKFVEWFKGLVFEGIENLASLYPADFIRGFYDSEGCLTIHKSHKRLSMGNTKREKLKLVGKALQKLGFNYSIDCWRNKLVGFYYELKLQGGTQEVDRFIKYIAPTIKGRNIPLRENANVIR